MASNLRKLIFFILVLGVSLIAYQYMIKPANEHLAGAKLRVNNKLSKLREFERATAAAEDLSQQLEQLEEAIHFFESKKNNSGYIEQPLEMKLVGNFNSFYSFLLELEKLPRIMKIRQLKLDKQKNNDGQVTADMVMSIFFQNEA